MQNVTTEELVGLFESIILNDEKVEDHKGTIKMINADSAKLIKDFSTDKEVDAKDVKAAYKYYKQKQNSTKKSDSDAFFTLISLVDMAAENDAKKIEEEEKAKGRA